MHAVVCFRIFSLDMICLASERVFAPSAERKEMIWHVNISVHLIYVQIVFQKMVTTPFLSFPFLLFIICLLSLSQCWPQFIHVRKMDSNLILQLSLPPLPQQTEKFKIYGRSQFDHAMCHQVQLNSWIKLCFSYRTKFKNKLPHNKDD
jgi:hypothetical protein